MLLIFFVNLESPVRTGLFYFMVFKISRFANAQNKVKQYPFELSETPGWNVILGDNGVGKSWILEDLLAKMNDGFLIKPGNYTWKKLDGKIIKRLDYLSDAIMEAQASWANNRKHWRIFQKFISQKGLLPNGSRFVIDNLRIFYIELASGYRITALNDIMDSSIGYVTGPKKNTSFGIENSLNIAIQCLTEIELLHGYVETIENIIQNKGKCTLPITLLLDEPEIGLSPELQLRLSRWLTKHFPAVRFIIATHSPFMCRPAARSGSVYYIPPLYIDAEPYEVTGAKKADLCGTDISACYATGLFGKLK